MFLTKWRPKSSHSLLEKLQNHVCLAPQADSQEVSLMPLEDWINSGFGQPRVPSDFPEKRLQSLHVRTFGFSLGVKKHKTVLAGRSLWNKFLSHNIFAGEEAQKCFRQHLNQTRERQKINQSREINQC